MEVFTPWKLACASNNTFFFPQRAGCLTFTYTSCAVLWLVTQSCPTLCNTMDCSPPGSSVLGDSPGKNTEVGCHALLQGVFPTHGLNPGVPHCRQILYWLGHQERQLTHHRDNIIETNKPSLNSCLCHLRQEFEEAKPSDFGVLIGKLRMVSNFILLLWELNQALCLARNVPLIRCIH